MTLHPPGACYFLRLLLIGGLGVSVLLAEERLPLPNSANSFSEADFITLSDSLDPEVAYAVRPETESIDLAIEVEKFSESAPEPTIEIAVAAEKRLHLNGYQAERIPLGKAVRFAFRIPRSTLGLPADHSDFRFAVRVIWPGKASQVPTLIQRYRDNGMGAAFEPISTEIASWEPLDMAAHLAAVRSRSNQIAFVFPQPAAGRASIVIEKSDGERVRSIVSGADMSAGAHRVVWDGLSDAGGAVEPGTYRWRAISHAGIRPKYLFSFYNEGKPPFGLDNPLGNWGGDHSNPTAAASFGDDIYLGWPLAEAGFNIVRTNLQGTKQGHIRIPPHVSGGQMLMLAADGDRVYAAVEGRPSYDAIVNQTDGTWKCRRPLSVLAWTREGKPIPFDGPRGEHVVADNYYDGRGPIPMWLPSAENLAGFAVLNESIYVSLRQENRIAVLNAKTGRQVREIALPRPGLLAVKDGGQMYAFSGDQLGILDTVSGTFHALGKPPVGSPRGLAVSPQHELLISDNGPDQDVKVLSLEGEYLRSVGRKGGRAPLGPWQSDGVYQPFGITVDRQGKLWVAEDDRTPRRISVWESQSGKLVKELFGPTDYGAPGGSFDPEDSTRWIGGGVLWSLDFAAKSAHPLSTLYRAQAGTDLIRRLDEYRFQFVREGGRTFVLGQSRQIAVYELTKELTLKPLALLGSLTAMSNTLRWTLPLSISEVPTVKESIRQAAQELRIDPASVFVPSGRNGSWIELSDKLIRKADVDFLWTDKNGDSQPTADEFEFLPKDTKWEFGEWGSGQSSLSMDLLVASAAKTRMIRLIPKGFLPSGAPDYRLSEAMRAAVDLPQRLSNVQATATDSQGRLLVNSDPMTALDTAGKIRWTLPSGWAGVHGSHKAPLPKRGEIQAALFFLGVAPLDAAGDVTVLNGNYGRDMVLTTDGIYLDDFFSDIRMSVETGAYRTEGEPFGGYFGRSRQDGKYYLQSGKPDYRIFELEGLDTIRRSEGQITVSAEQAAIAHSLARSKTQETVTQKSLTVIDVPEDTELSADPSLWPGEWLAEWGDSSAEYPYSTAKVVRKGARLLIAWNVKDPSPWVNNGADWKQMFKTGDAVAFEFSTDPSAKIDRARPTRGDRRLLIVPFEGKPIAVLYDYQNTEAKAPVLFSSPWRTEKIDVVRQLDDARVTVTPKDGGYVVTADIPAASLGLPKAGQTGVLAGDFGVIYGDAAGSVNILRSYWSNRETGLVDDVPGEATVKPGNWGSLVFP